jgi:hypothetical protein
MREGCGGRIVPEGEWLQAAPREFHGTSEWGLLAFL